MSCRRPCWLNGGNRKGAALPVIASSYWSYLSGPCPTFLWLLSLNVKQTLIEQETAAPSCWWRLILLDFPFNSFHKTWQSVKQSIVCERRKSIILVGEEREDGQMVAASLFLGGFRLSLDPESSRHPNSHFLQTQAFLKPRTSLFCNFRHFYSLLDTSTTMLSETLKKGLTK